jgi:tRNA U34 5-methylaminomethyl-2-thiouridine-forming methyltransferase MnmC
MPDTENFTPQPTADGSLTFFSEEFNELFHSHFGARQESFQKFVVPTQLENQAVKPVLRLLDICYGLGCNTAAALETIWAINPNCNVEIIGLELNSTVPKAAISHNIYRSWGCKYTSILAELANNNYVEKHNLKATLLIGDARRTIQQIHKSGFQADAIFLDPFSPPQCPQLWSAEFIKCVSTCLHLDGLLATYSCAASVRAAILAAGLTVASTPPVGRKTSGTVAGYSKLGGVEEVEGVNFSSSSLPWSRLSRLELEHLQTRAAIPYRDPHLCDCKELIVERRKKEQEISSLEPTSHWRKRWLAIKFANKV